MEKFRNTEIKNFEYSDLQGSHVVGKNQAKPFEFKNLINADLASTKISEEKIRIERNFANKSNFKVDDIVRDSRGIANQEQNDLEQRIQEEVRIRFELAYEDAYKEGIEKGKQEGRELAYNEYKDELNVKVDEVQKVVGDLQSHTHTILEKNKLEVYEFIKRFTKWIVLKEIDEKVYLESLLEKLILEINARKNLIIKVGKSHFAQMPEIIAGIETRIGQLPNVRVEIVSEIHYPGIILESENGLIDGSLEGIFLNMDKIFEQVIKHE
jgi:flagellar assembly protein FliH